MGNRPRALGVQKWPQKHTFERSKAKNFTRDFSREVRLLTSPCPASLASDRHPCLKYEGLLSLMGNLKIADSNRKSILPKKFENTNCCQQILVNSMDKPVDYFRRIHHGAWRVASCRWHSWRCKYKPLRSLSTCGLYYRHSIFLSCFFFQLAVRFLYYNIIIMKVGNINKYTSL